MIIDAMDILYTKSVEGFCIVSSDSDFTRLAIRLREAGMKVLGFGEKKTPNSFIVACDKFIYIEVIRDAFKQAARPVAIAPPEKLPAAVKPKAIAAASTSGAVQAEQPEQASAAINLPDAVIELIAGSVQDIADEEGYAFMGELGNLLLKKQPDFDPRNFGFAKLTSMIKSISRFEIDARKTRDPNIKHIYLRDKNAT
jgi:Fe-S-cluster formation regulator IscX/YfhJ